MARIKTFSGYLLVTVFTAWASPALAAGDGYEGLFAPSHEDTPAPVVAPAKTKKQETPGYTGVMTDPGAAPSDKDGLAISQPPPPLQYTPSPLRTNVVIPDLGLAAAAYNAKAPELKSPLADYSGVEQPKINGKPAVSYVIDNRIAQALASVNKKDVSPEEHDKNYRSALKSLSTLADGLRLRQTMPDSLYKSMHLSDTYIRDEKASDADALKKLDAAIQTLKSLQ